MNEKKPKTKRAARSPAAKPKNKRTKPKNETSNLQEVGERVRAVLLELMCTSESDSVRVAAAKALLDRMKPEKDPGQGDDANGQERDSDEILDEARAILAAFAEAKSGGSSGAVQVDQDGQV